MMSIIHLISAMRRLKEAKKTVIMLGGEQEAPPMIRAQRDMIELEVEYYTEEVQKFFLYGILWSLVLGIAYFIYMGTHYAK